MTLWISSGQPLHLVSALSDDGSASGDLFWDDGETIDTYETDRYTYVVFNVSQVQRVCPPLWSNLASPGPTLSGVLFRMTLMRRPGLI